MQFPQIGESFLELLMNRLKITKVRVLGDEHVGPDTYASLKKGVDLKVSYYIHFADHLLKAKGEEVFRHVVQEGVDAYINNWKRKEAAEEKAYELKKQAEKLEALRERMKQHKDIL